MSSALSFLTNLTAPSSIKRQKEITKTQKWFDDLIIQLLKDYPWNQSTIPSHTKKIEKLSTYMSAWYRLYFDKKYFTEETFEGIIGKKWISKWSNYISSQMIDITSIIFPYLLKIIFENADNWSQIHLIEEILLMNPQTISCIQTLISVSFDIFILDSKAPFWEECVVPFIDILMDKLIVYPNFYYVISSKIEKANKAFDSHLFELVVNWFSIEYNFINRESRTIIRQSLMKCLNWEYFYKVNIANIEKWLEYLVSNLISYYGNYVWFDIGKYLLTHRIPKGVTGEDINLITIDDTISYLKFFSMITHCFAEAELKNYLSNILFNNFFCEYLQKDIISLSSSYIFNMKLTRVLEFIYFITKYINNYEICEIWFYFLFGFNYYNWNNSDDEEDDKNEANDDIDEDIILKDLLDDNGDVKVKDKEKDKERKKDKEEPWCHQISVNKIRETISGTLRRTESKIGTFSSNVNLNIEKSNHNFESIIAFFTLVIESKDYNNKAFLLGILTNIANTTPYIFMTELIVPYYLNYLCNTQPKHFDKLCDSLKTSRDKIDMIDILKTIHPRNYSITSENWWNYWDNNIEINYNRNINMLNRIDSATLNWSDESSETSAFNSNNNFLAMNSNNISISEYNSVLTYNNCMSNDGWDNITNIHPENSWNYMINNYTVNLRIKFYECLLERFKKFSTNAYIENLYFSKFCMEIASIPFSINKGDKGEQLYNIYTNVTYADKKKKKYFAISLVGVMYKIKKDIDEKMRFNFTKEEADKLIAMRKNEMNNPGSTGSSIGVRGDNNSEFFSNVILYNEMYKEFLSNIFSKACIDQINFGWNKKVVDLN